MFEFSTRQKCVGIAILAVLIGLGVGLGLEMLRPGPSARDARTALAECGWCAPDAPIVERDGLVIIGNVRCDLAQQRFGSGSDALMYYRFMYQQNDDFLSRNISWTPFGCWVVPNTRLTAWRRKWQSSGLL